MPTEVLLSIRGPITERTGLICAAVILQFCMFHLSRGSYILAAVDLFAAVVFGGNAWALMLRNRPLLPYPVLVAALAAAALGSIYFVGVSALHWASPATLFFYMVLPLRQAHIACALFLLSAAGLAYMHQDLAGCLRFVVTSSLTLLLLNVVLRQLAELQQRLVEQSLTDPLTGALNRRGLDGTLEHLNALGAQGRSAVLMSFDIDHFKSINDRLGHAAGDEVLRQVAMLARSRLRATDRLYRVGGEEFVLALSDIHPEDARRVAEELRQCIADATLLPQGPVTVSIGLSPWAPGVSPDSWLNAVDTAMYEAKRQGRNRVVVSGACGSPA